MEVCLLDVTTAVTIAAASLAVLGTIFGWFRKVGGWVKHFFSKSDAYLPVPKRSVILLTRDSGGFTWGDATRGKGRQPVTELRWSGVATNITKYSITLVSCWVDRVSGFSTLFVEDPDTGESGAFPISSGVTVDISATFTVDPRLDSSRDFYATLVFIDNFGNRHKIKKVHYFASDYRKMPPF